MARLLDPKRRGQKKFPFEYRNSANTDVRITWDKARKVRQENEAERIVKVRIIGKVKP